MAVYDQYRRTPQQKRSSPDGLAAQSATNHEKPIGDLLRSLTDDASTLLRAEVALAKAELRENVQAYVKDAARLGVAAAVGWIAALAFVAFLILGLSAVLDNAWLAALIVTIALALIAAGLAKSALDNIKQNDLAPDKTAATLRRDKQWAQREVRDFKQQIKA